MMKMDKQKQTGFTMLEVLVTMIIVSFGLLGIAGIIMNGLKNNQSSYSRSQASWLANDIADRMRANYIVAQSAALPYNLTLAATTPAAVSPVTIVNSDIIAWRTAIANTLTSGTGSISLNATTRLVTVVVQWDDSRAEGGKSNESFTIETIL